MVNGSQFEKKILFEEIQQFRQTWLWFIVLPLTIFGVIVFVYLMYMQLVLGKPVGDKPMSNGMLIWFGPLMLIIIVSIPILLFTSKLAVQIDAEAIHIRFTPFLKRDIGLNEIITWQARKYKPLLEYGGWGIRWGPSGKAYNISGSWGVQLQFMNGKRLLIGSQKAQDFARAIEYAKKG
jgi:hypothetical protein